MSAVYRQGRFYGLKHQSGLTLIELMIAALLAIFLVGGILLLHLSGRSTFIDAEQLSRIQENVRFASDYMIRDIRNAGFRDEAVLRAGHEQQIREEYAQVIDDDADGIGDTLRIRYAGRGHCTEAFDEFRLVENEYSLDANTGALACRGRTVPRDDPGDTDIEAQAFSNPVGLVGGLTGLAFQLVCPDGSTVCSCDIATDLDSACIGVRVAMQFEGMRALDLSGNFDNRSIELTAAFRNVVLDRVNAHAFAEAE
jgi:type II secretory pathway component PulJ